MVLEIVLLGRFSKDVPGWFNATKLRYFYILAFNHPILINLLSKLILLGLNYGIW